GLTQASGLPDVPTVTGCGLTWTPIGTIARYDPIGAGASKAICAYVANTNVETPSVGALTVDFAGVTQQGLNFSLFEFDGLYNDGGSGAGVVVQSKVGVVDGGTSISIVFDSTVDIGNVSVGIFGTNANADITPGAGLTEIHDVG